MNELNSIVEDTIRRHAGLSLEGLNKKIIVGLENRLSPTNAGRYKDAKKSFQKAYFRELLVFSLGNISKAADAANLNRRHVHRICQELEINAESIRHEMVKPYNYLKQNVQDIIHDKVEAEKTIDKEKDRIYQKMDDISKNIAEKMEIRLPTYKDALDSFEKNYFTEILKLANNDIDKASKMAELSGRSIQRRMKELAI